MADSCGCGPGPAMIFSCSGSSDIGAIADQAARRLTLEGKGKMSCLAQVGAGNEKVIANAKCAGTVVAIDGCPLDCVAKILEKAGISGFKHLRLTEQGFKKGLSPPNAENVGKAVQAVCGILPAAPGGAGGCCG
jgi:uncharacterized metal-binding protein